MGRAQLGSGRRLGPHPVTRHTPTQRDPLCLDQLVCDLTCPTSRDSETQHLAVIWPNPPKH